MNLKQYLTAGFLTAGLAGLAGCGLFQSSETWKAVSQVPHPWPDGAQASQTYAFALDRVLTVNKVGHEVVEFRYQVAMREVPVPEFGGDPRLHFDVSSLVFWRRKSGPMEAQKRFGVVYQDAQNPVNPWWYMDNFLRHPIWLPNGSLEQQLHFVMHRPVEILGAGRGKPEMVTTPKTTKWLVLFQKRNGTPYDPASAMDREKLRQLQSSGGL